MEYLDAGRLLYRQARRYLSDVMPLIQETFISTLSLVRLYVRLLLHLLRPVLSLLLTLHSLLSPLLSALTARLWRLLVQQPPRVLAFEAAAATSLLILIALERHFRVFGRASALVSSVSNAVRSRYRALIAGVRRQSRLAAAALPHLLFASLALLFHRAVGPTVEPIFSGATGLLLVLLKPVLTTVRLLYAVEFDDVSDPHMGDDDDDELLDSPDVGSRRPLLESTPVGRSSVRRRRSQINTPRSEPVRTRARARMERQRHREMEMERENEAADANLITRRSSEASDIIDGEKSGSDGEGALVIAEMRTPPRRSRRSPFAEGAKLREGGETVALRFWVVFGLLWTARSLVWYFVPAVLGTVVERLDVALLYVVMWAQLGLTRGADLVYGLLSRVTGKRWREGRTALVRIVAVLVRMAVALNLVRAERAVELESTVAESGLAMTGIVFLITPRVATFMGTLWVGLLVPTYLSTGVMETKAAAAAGMHNWLAYWAVMAMVETMFVGCADMLGWLPLWYHGKMVGILWLQLPYYRGSVVVLDAGMRYVGAMLSRVRREVVTPRKRKVA